MPIPNQLAGLLSSPCDARSARRLRRRLIADRSFNPLAPTLQLLPYDHGSELPDPDYMELLGYLVESSFPASLSLHAGAPAAVTTRNHHNDDGEAFLRTGVFGDEDDRLHGTHGNGRLDNRDPQYLSFLQNLTVDVDNSYRLDWPLSDGKVIVVKYETGHGCNIENLDAPKDCPNRHETTSLERKRFGSRQGPNDSRKERTEAPRKMWDNPSQESKKPLTEKRSNKVVENHVASRVKGRGIKRTSPESPLPNNGEEDASDSEVIALDIDPFSDGINSPFVTSKEYGAVDEDGAGTVGNKSSKFREEVMKILKNPYDQKEYERLYDEADRRRLVEHHRELRSGSKPYPTQIIGKSYLDLHKDLEAQIKSAKCNQQKINLLRGFFYWLQNLTQMGTFKPWLDSSCLTLQPREK